MDPIFITIAFELRAATALSICLRGFPIIYIQIIGELFPQIHMYLDENGSEMQKAIQILLTTFCLRAESEIQILPSLSVRIVVPEACLWLPEFPLRSFCNV